MTDTPTFTPQPYNADDNDEAGDVEVDAIIAAFEDDNTCVICDPPKSFAHTTRPAERARTHLREKHGVKIPRSTTAATSASKSKPRTSTLPRSGPSLEKRFAASLGTIGLGVSFLCPICGDTFIAGIQGDDGLARAWVQVANENETVKTVVEVLSGGGAWGLAIMATLTVTLPMLGHHTNLVPARIAQAMGHQHAANGQTAPTPTAEPAVNEDGSVDFMGQHLTAEQVQAGLASFGFDTNLTDATEVRVAS
jgi:hypothetical protein